MSSRIFNLTSEKLYLAVLTAAIFLAGCSGKEPLQVSPPDPEPAGPELIIEDSDIMLEAIGNTTTAISFTTNVDWSLSISDAGDGTSWLRLETASGPAGEQTVEISAYTTAKTESRTAYLDIIYGDKLKRLFVVQMGADEDENFASYFSPEFAQWLVEKDYLGNAERITSADIALITKIESDERYPIAPDGIELLYNLEVFTYNYPLSEMPNSLDFSQNTKLKILDCSNFKLSSLNLSGCQELTSLACGYNNLTSLDIKNCPNLETLACHSNKELTSLDVSNCRKLKSLSCGGTQITELDLTNCWQLEMFSYEYITGGLKDLDLSGHKHLSYLYCTNNTSLTSIDVSDCPNLEDITVFLNEALTSLDISNCPKLDYAKCYTNCSLTEFNATGCTVLRKLHCHGNKLSSLDLTGSLLKMEELTIYSNPGDEVSKFTIKSEWMTNETIPDMLKIYYPQWEYEGKTIYADFQVVE